MKCHKCKNKCILNERDKTRLRKFRKENEVNLNLCSDCLEAIEKYENNKVRESLKLNLNISM